MLKQNSLWIVMSNTFFNLIDLHILMMYSDSKIIFTLTLNSIIVINYYWTDLGLKYEHLNQESLIRTFPAKFLLPTFKNHFCDLAYFYNRDKQFH
jgi:hypothetical protein